MKSVSGETTIAAEQVVATHEWVPGQVWDLIVTLDDATSEIYGAFFPDPAPARMQRTSAEFVTAASCSSFRPASTRSATGLLTTPTLASASDDRSAGASPPGDASPSLSPWPSRPIY